MRVTLDDVMGWIEEIKEEYQREEDQGILQQRLDKASYALSGKEACERIKRGIRMRFGFQQNIAMVNEKRKRA
jgi:hypothetical protein